MAGSAAPEDATDETEVLIIGGSETEYIAGLRCVVWLGDHPGERLPDELREQARIVPWAAYKKQR